jgi:DNA-binding NtrC family response regulator
VVDCDVEARLDLGDLLFGIGSRGGAGLLGSPDAGTVVLAGIDKAPLQVQRKLLQAIEENTFVSSDLVRPRPVTVRLLAVAGPAYGDAVRAGTFERELAERLALSEIPIPPLRERMNDIPDLVTHLVGQLSRRFGRPAPAVNLEARAALLRYPWPGNVRELRNVLEQALVLLDGSVLRESDLPPISSVRTSSGPENLRAARQVFEREHIERVLERYGGDKEAAARALGVDLTTLYRKLAAPGR